MMTRGVRTRERRRGDSRGWRHGIGVRRLGITDMVSGSAEAEAAWFEQRTHGLATHDRIAGARSVHV